MPASPPNTCPVCGFDLAEDGYPLGHRNSEGDECTYRWAPVNPRDWQETEMTPIEILAQQPDTPDLEDFASFLDSDADRDLFWERIREARTN